MIPTPILILIQIQIQSLMIPTLTPTRIRILNPDQVHGVQGDGHVHVHVHVHVPGVRGDVHVHGVQGDGHVHDHVHGVRGGGHGRGRDGQNAKNDADNQSVVIHQDRNPYHHQILRVCYAGRVIWTCDNKTLLSKRQGGGKRK